MYTITFEIGEKKVVKTAKNEKEVRQVVYAYTTGSQKQKEEKVSEILLSKTLTEINEEKKIIKNKKLKSETDVNL
jgi:hypothetical protein